MDLRMKHPLALCVAAALASLAALPAAAQAPAEAAAPARFTLTRVQFPETTAVPPDVLQQAVAPFIGKEISSAELGPIAAAVRRVYEDRGLGLAGVAFPSQNLAGGVLLVAISEPRIARLIVENPEKPSPTPARARCSNATVSPPASHSTCASSTARCTRSTTGPA